MAAFLKYENWPESLMTEKAKNELNEDANTREQDIQEFRNMVVQNVEKSGEIELSDEFLLKFLRARKFSIERALKLLSNYLQLRSKHAKIFQEIVSERTEVIRKMKDSKCISVLPFRTEEGCPIVVIRIENWNLETTSTEEFFTMLMLTFESLVNDGDTNQVNGVITLVDVKGASLKHLMAFTKTKWIVFSRDVMQDSFPLRFKEVHIINSFKLLDAFLYLLWPFLSQKMKKRINTYGKDLGKLREKYSPNILPVEFGGKTGPFNCDWWAQKLTNMADL